MDETTDQLSSEEIFERRIRIETAIEVRESDIEKHRQTIRTSKQTLVFLQDKCRRLGHPGKERTGGHAGGFITYRCNTCGAEWED